MTPPPLNPVGILFGVPHADHAAGSGLAVVAEHLAVSAAPG